MLRLRPVYLLLSILITAVCIVAFIFINVYFYPPLFVQVIFILICFGLLSSFVITFSDMGPIQKGIKRQAARIIMMDNLGEKKIVKKDSSRQKHVSFFDEKDNSTIYIMPGTDTKVESSPNPEKFDENFKKGEFSVFIFNNDKVDGV